MIWIADNFVCYSKHHLKTDHSTMGQMSMTNIPTKLVIQIPTVQGESKYLNNVVFKWPKAFQGLNGLNFEWHLNTRIFKWLVAILNLHLYSVTYGPAFKWFAQYLDQKCKSKKVDRIQMFGIWIVTEKSFPKVFRNCPKFQTSVLRFTKLYYPRVLF